MGYPPQNNFDVNTLSEKKYFKIILGFYDDHTRVTCEIILIGYPPPKKIDVNTPSISK